MKMARQVGLLTLLLLLLLAPRFAIACKCVPVDDVRELERKMVVFTGRSIESLSDLYCDREPGTSVRRHIGGVFRFIVQKSLDLAEGSEVLVFADVSSSCGTWFEPGEEHLVLATEVGGFLLADECPSLGPNEQHDLRELLAVPKNWREGSRAERRFASRASCERPATLEEAMQRADTVGWTSSVTSCVALDGGLEKAALLETRWKGPAEDSLILVKVSPGADGREHFDGWLDLQEETDRSWPPAEFLRRQRDTYVNDGCVTPLPPRSVEDGIEAIERWLPLPERRAPDTRTAPIGSDWALPGYRRRGVRCEALPELSCGTLRFSMLRDAENRLERYFVASSWKYDIERDRSPRSEAPSRSGSCAGCAVSSSSGVSSSGALLALLLACWRRRSTRVRT